MIYMRKYLIPIIAVVFATTLSSFEKVTYTVFFVYEGSGDHDISLNYEQTFGQQYPLQGTAELAWFSIADDDGWITPGEFDEAFETLDVIGDGFNSLDDDMEVYSGVYRLEKITHWKP
jgi:hypothetical protein